MSVIIVTTKGHPPKLLERAALPLARQLKGADGMGLHDASTKQPAPPHGTFAAASGQLLSRPQRLAVLQGIAADGHVGVALSQRRRSLAV